MSRRGLVVLAVVGLQTVVGCAPGTPDGDSWRIDAQRAVSDASSAVQSAELALNQSSEDRVFDRYLQTVVLDSEKALGAAGDHIAARQPPRSERERYDAVTGQIDAAADLVSAARIAVVDGETYRYDGLAKSLADAAEALQSLETDLEHPPE